MPSTEAPSKTSTDSGPDLRRSPRAPSAPAEASRVDRLPPHSPEAEQGVLGCILLEPNECLNITLERFRKAREVFYDLRHQSIFDVLVEMYESREAIDLITLTQRLKDRSLLDKVGGLTYLSSLPDAVPSAANLEYYADIVREKNLQRKMIRICTEAVTRIYEHSGDVDQLMDEVERDVLKTAEERVEGGSLGIRDLVHKAINTIEDFHSRKGALTGLATGYMDLDKMTSGFRGGEMIVVAARPSMGKTSLAMNIVEHVVTELKLPVGVFSLEMTSESLVLRMMCSMARVNLRNVMGGFLVERDFPRLTRAAGRLAEAPLHIDDTSGLSILQLRAKARRMHNQHGIKMFVVDYMQLLTSTSKQADQNRQQEISEISRGIKALAKELDVPVIVLSQLNRDMEKDKNRKPRLSDLRESGAIEQDADLVGLLYRPGKSDEDESVPRDEPGGVPINLLIAKQRNGPTGDVPLTFLKGFTRFESAAKVSDSDVPSEQ